MCSLCNERFADEIAKVLSKTSQNLRDLGQLVRNQEATEVRWDFCFPGETSKILLTDR